MRLPFIAGNWKMNTTVAEAVRLVAQMRTDLDGIGGVEKVLCPPFVSLTAVKALLEGTSIKLGAQNTYFEPKGAYTGEVSPTMLSGICEFVIIGHSERRQYFGETGAIVNKKVAAVWKAGLKPILCVGERLEENEAGRTEQVITEQVQAGLAGVDDASGLVVAYEPVWAIGTGRAATGGQANGTIGLIRQLLSKHYSLPAADAVRILYGGSVTSENAAEFFSQPEIDGALVGGASLNAHQFVSIVREAARLRGAS